jgi:uncharacterized protein YbjT (DUF2867 family)
VATACLLDPEKHNGQMYRLGYEARTYYGVAEIFTQVIGQPFSYEPRPPEEFYRNVLAAGADPPSPASNREHWQTLRKRTQTSSDTEALRNEDANTPQQ